ncbi:MAG: hypothetical protein C6Y22_23090 [Hapalosiphonaceae cyanobacterium JJU2]|nr:MAG: hypothetical protein C6Y22_23090 [Hapalosiphonaceae cyanobacterium JJU2]
MIYFLSLNKFIEIVISWGEWAERSLVLRLLNRWVGQLPNVVVERVESLPIEQLEVLR